MLRGHMKHVVIVGGGFAGLNAAKALGQSGAVRVTLIDRRNHHLFQPLLYQVAMAGLSPAEIAAPIRSLLARYRDVQVIQGDVRAVQLDQHRVDTEFGPVDYDYLLLACGSQHAYFGHPEWEECAPGLKSIEQATEIRRRVLTSFEMAERETDASRKKALLTFVVIGAGPTGVELAGAIGEMSRFTLARDFKNIDPKLTRVILVEAGPRLLPSFSTKLASRAMRDLEMLGVQTWTSSRVTGITPDGVELGSERIQAATVLWAAGVQAAAINKTLGLPLDSSGRVSVAEDLTLPGQPNVFVAGDQAACRDKDGKLVPGTAPVALQQGNYVARTILADVAGNPRAPFRYFSKGQMATIGRSRAIVQMGALQFGGFAAWIAWLVVHIYYLTGFSNRFMVVCHWAWSYLTFSRGARLIVGKEWRLYPPAPKA